MGLVETLPPYDTQFGPDVAMKVMPVLGGAGDFVHGARLRAKPEIALARDVAELWHWRSRTTRLMRGEVEVETPPGWTLEQIVAEAARAGHDRGDLGPPIENEFPAFGKPYASLSEEENSQATSIARERHFGFNWLCGYSDDWESTPTDT